MVGGESVGARSRVRGRRVSVVVVLPIESNDWTSGKE